MQDILCPKGVYVGLAIPCPIAKAETLYDSIPDPEVSCWRIFFRQKLRSVFCAVATTFLIRGRPITGLFPMLYMVDAHADR